MVRLKSSCIFTIINPQLYVTDDLFNAPPTTDYDFMGGEGGDAGGDVIGEMDPSQAYAAIAAADARIQQLKAEPPKIAQWREEHNRMLQEKGLLRCIRFVISSHGPFPYFLVAIMLEWYLPSSVHGLLQCERSVIIL